MLHAGRVVAGDKADEERPARGEELLGVVEVDRVGASFLAVPASSATSAGSS
jgi:hypothetical protein